MPLNRKIHGPALSGVVVALLLGPALGMVEGPDSSESDDGGMIQLNLPPTVELRVLIEYVSRRLGINIVYDEGLGARRGAISSPGKIHKSDLLDLLKDVLKMSSLELVDTALPGWKTIGREVSLRFVRVKHLNAADLAKQVSSLLGERERIRGVGRAVGARPVARVARTRAPAVTPGATVTLVPDPRTNQIVIIATAPAGAEALKLIEALDVPVDLETRSYRFRYIAPQRIDALIRGRVGAAEPETAYSSIIDEASGLLIATGTAKVHKQIGLLKQELDVEGDPNRSYLRFYKLVNTTAAEVLATIESLRGKAVSGTETDKKLPFAGGALEEFVGPNRPPTPGTAEPPKPPAYKPSPAPATAPEAEASWSASTVLAQEATVTADQNTNTIIVVAPPGVQKMYEQLITTLDKRRPQVLVEVTLVAINTTDNFSLGVELARADFGDDHTSIVFSSFGLSTFDTLTGVPTLKPGAGFNGVLLSPDSLSVVVRALAEDARTDVLAAPRILVNDNATGTLASIDEAPYTSVNASDTVATTSFAGYASAGTTITVTPHISEGEHLQLEYSVTLNSFNFEEGGAAGVPPPRFTDTITSHVTIPNGYAIIVGGLRRKDVIRTVSKVPFLGDIPGLKHLFRLQEDKDIERTLFVFIRPLILRDDKFEDLKYLSQLDLELAELPPNLPVTEPLIMR